MKKVLFVFSFVFVLTGCKKEETACQFSAGSSVAPANEKSMVTSYLSTNNISNAVELGNSGMYYVIDVAGSGNKPGQCSFLNVKYIGKYQDGTVFDQTSGSNTAAFTLGQLIEGWKRGVPLIGAGGKIRLYIPPTLGYGPAGVFNSSTGNYTIPPNAMLIFEVELVSIS
ncbi:MAG TPA: FKBP-type peptidyl-prolyl cis-trans isomerase [Chitinophagaceae bacterium]|nr:FKBP-type peptidyl-prolyl cis-trans isomerase [Chitinophagaceae bacterium]